MNKCLINRIFFSIFFITFFINISLSKDYNASKNINDSLPYLRNRIDYLYNISLAYIFTNTNSDSAVKYAEEAMFLSKKIQYLQGEAKYNEVMSLYSSLQEDYINALRHLFIYLNIQTNLKNIHGQIIGYLRIANLFASIGNLNNANLYWQKALIIGKISNQLSDFGQIYLTGGYILYKSEQYIQSYHMTLKGLKYFERCNNIFHEARCLRLLGDICIKTNAYDEAIDYYEKSKEMFLQTNCIIEEGNIYTRISHVHQLKGDLQKVLKYDKMALSSRNKIKKMDYVASSLINIGEYYFLTSNNDSAEFYFLKGINILENLGKFSFLDNAYLQLSRLYLKKKNQEKSFNFYKLYANLHTKIIEERSKSEIGVLVTNQLIKEQEDRNELLKKEFQIQKLQNRNRTILLLFILLLLLFSIFLIIYVYRQYRKNKKSKDILQNLNLQLASEINERKITEERLRESESLHRFLTTNSLDIISRIDKDFKTVYISPSCKYIFGYDPEEIIALNFMDLIHPDSMETFKLDFDDMIKFKEPTKFTYKARRKDGTYFWAESHVNPIFEEKTGELRELIAVLRDISIRIDQEEALEESARQKELLMREIHHRAKNNFAILVSLMSLQKVQSNDENLNKHLSDLQSRVRTMALIHEQLYRGNSIKTVSFGDYLLNLSNIISAAYKKEGIILHADLEDCSLPIETALPLGLIVNELLTNSFKYAFNGRGSGNIWLELKPFFDDHVESEPEEYFWRLSIRDDGIGLPREYNIASNESMGSRIIQSLVGQINAELTVSNKNGASFEIIFSESAEE